MSHPNGAICHVELFARDLQESAKFYGGLFSWKFNPHDAGYLFWRAPGGSSGGFTTGGAPATNPASTFYIKVASIPKTLEKIKTKGGVLIRERTAIPGDNGFYALFRDPAGNNVGLWSAK